MKGQDWEEEVMEIEHNHLKRSELAISSQQARGLIVGSRTELR